MVSIMKERGDKMLNELDVIKLYVATFNRAPDTPGLWYWVYDSGLRLEDVAKSFFDQPETQRLYPPNSSTEYFIKSVYKNLFNREPDSGGLDYWKRELDSHNIPRSQFILAVIRGARGDDADILENKTEVGQYYALRNINDINFAKRVMENVDMTRDSVLRAERLIDNYILSHS